MKRSTVFAAVVALAGISAFGADESCQRCHTDEATMKSLFVPPVLSASEGEG